MADQTTVPFNVWIMDVDGFIARNHCKPVTSLALHDPASGTTMHPEGLFSEEIFGQIGSPERLVRHGYVDLNCMIIQPPIYKSLMSLAVLYEDILTGHALAYFNPETEDFEKTTETDTRPGVGTGYTYFMSYLPKIKFRRNDSDGRNNKIAMIEKYRSVLMCDRLIVEPAGLRDLDGEVGALTQEDINKLYRDLLSYSFGLPIGSTSDLYDAVRTNIQKKAVAIYDYIVDILDGKKGMVQGAWARRRVAMGTRNVITAATYSALSPDDPQFQKPTETKVGLFQSMKAFQPIVVHHLKISLFDTIFAGGNQVPVIDPKTWQLEYREISSKELARFNTNPALENLITLFQNADVRDRPITVTDVTGKQFYLCMVYDTGDEISLFRTFSDFETMYKRPIDKSKVRPLTWVEIFYMVTFNATSGRHVQVTRYPVLEEGSSYPTKIHLASTSPGRVVRMRDVISDTLTKQYPQYPILGKPYHESMALSVVRLKGMGADHDGDTSSANGVWADESNAECDAYINSVQALINTQKRFVAGANTDNIAFTIFNMTLL